MSDGALKFEQVTRRFGRTTAVDRLDLTVEPGSVLGLVGRNGAGKTTSLRLALGMLYADGGRIRVLGLDPVEQAQEVRTRVSLLSEESHLYPWMTVREVLEFGAALHPRWDDAQAKKLSARLELEPDKRLQTLSRGTKAKAPLVLGVACRPELLRRDDPTAGLDPLVRREVLQGVLEAVPEQGGAVVYASHLIHDVERVADRVAFLDAGQVRLEGSVEALKGEVRRVTAVFGERAPANAALPGQLDVTTDGRVLSIVARGASDDLAARARELGACEVEVEPMSLEEIVVACLRRNGATEAEHA
jgi:ABC-2 type transport system ATP-binding protein